MQLGPPRAQRLGPAAPGAAGRPGTMTRGVAPADRGPYWGSAGVAPRSMRPCGRRRPLTRPCAPAAAWCGPGARPAGLARRGCRCPPPPPPPAPPALAAPAAPSAPLLPPPRRRPARARPATCASARCGSAAQVTALPRKRGAERRAPGFPGPLPAPSAARAGPRARDAPPRGTVPTTTRARPGTRGPSLTWVPHPDWSPHAHTREPRKRPSPPLRATVRAWPSPPPGSRRPQG